MFTGIIETIGTVHKIESEQSNLHFYIQSDISDALKVDQSVAHNGVCLTVVEMEPGIHKVTAIKETLEKSNLGELKEGDWVNLERCTQIGGRLDGHIVQGHVDQTAICIAAEPQDGSVIFTFEYEPGTKNITVEKGSITVNGISLTVLNSARNSFSVAIIPFTLSHTNLKDLQVGQTVNLEFDIIGKYVSKLLALRD
ncbi:riboflavin synthase [Sphingobacterium humi]|uniref:Riboflavin synthase n=1 Tax=Sphingobacterium humi TaxID=1796905 RepID=A0A6N8L085_9SPHI|nr:riboflavin synthase [Sphingobacterium humi]MVZ62717.1 riboflavin synthase [Sphingobacterium humi]